MYPLDDDNLDRISREAAEHFEVEASASGWDHLEKRLDKEMPQEKRRRRFLFWLFLITVTTGGALLGILKYQPVTPLEKNVTSAVTQVDNSTPLPDNQTGKTRTPNTTQNETVARNNETPVTTAAPATDKLPVESNQRPIAATSNTKPGTGKPATIQAAGTATATVPTKTFNQPVEKTSAQKSSKQNRVRIQKAPASLNYAVMVPLASANNQAYKPGKQKTGKRRSDVASHQKNEQAPTVSAKNTTTFEPQNRITNVDLATIGLPVNADNDVTTAQPATVTAADSAKKKTAAAQAADSTQPVAKQQKKKGEKIQQPLEFGIIAGPDMSAVAFGPLYKPGYNFGAQVGYRFSNRWSVNAGVIYTKKFYKTDSSHFEYKNNPWPTNKTLSTVEGNCSMWEIPVNVRYDFSYNDKRRWFASTGLSSYLMDKEDYEAYYRWNGGPTYDQQLINDTSNSKYFFSILNLSVGMERSLGKRFSLQAEPYLKIPLKDLGMGNMRMNSYGVLFTLKYKPFLHSKRSDSNNK